MNAIERVIERWRNEAKRTHEIAQKKSGKVDESIMSQSVRFWFCADELERLNREVIEPMRVALRTTTSSLIERNIGEHDMVRCLACGAEAHNDDPSHPYGLKHKQSCAWTVARDALAKLEGREDANGREA